MINRILVGFIEDGRHSGIDKYLLGFCKVAAENGVTLDFLTNEISPDMLSYLENLGFGLFEVPSLKKPLSQYRAIKKIIKNGNYDAVYFNISEAFNSMGLLAAKHCDIPVRIAHSHSSGVDRSNKYVRTMRTALHGIFRHRISAWSTRRLACSSVAGNWMFDKDYEIVYNAVNKERFVYNEDVRRLTRDKLSLGDEKTFIHIGHFTYAKNNFFLMDVMKEILKKDNNAVLLSVGTGADFDAVRDYAKKLGIDRNVRFLGVRDDVPALLCAADVFVFPSRFEGLSVTAVEAQFSGLPCVFSKGVSPETKLSERVCFLASEDAEKWADAALNSVSERHRSQLDETVLKKYDIDNQQYQLVSIIKGEENGKFIYKNSKIR